MTGLATSRVAPFGHLGISACVPLPRAYRSLPRPSSPPCAQASPTCLRSLDYIVVQAEHALSRIGRKDRFAECMCLQSLTTTSHQRFPADDQCREDSHPTI